MGLFSGLTDIVGGLINKSSGKGQRSGAEQAIDQQTGMAYDRGKMTPEELAQYSGSFDIGKLLTQIYKGQMGLGEMPAGYATPEAQYVSQTGDLGQQLYNTALADVKDPYASYESALQPQLQASQDYIQNYMQKRGLLNSGLTIEQMGRAGVDLAIQEAQNRMTYRQQALNNASTMAGNLQGTTQQNLANLASQYSNQQQFGQNAANRQAGQALGILGYQTAPQFARLGEAYGNILGGQKQINSGVQGIATSADQFMQPGSSFSGSFFA